VLSISITDNAGVAEETKKRCHVIPARAGIPFPWGKAGSGIHVPYGTVLWIPACAGMTELVLIGTKVR
jgi:hypothetical protein